MVLCCIDVAIDWVIFKMRLQRLHLAYLGTATRCLTRDWDCFPHSVHTRTVCLLPSVDSVTRVCLLPRAHCGFWPYLPGWLACLFYKHSTRAADCLGRNPVLFSAVLDCSPSCPSSLRNAFTLCALQEWAAVITVLDISSLVS